VTVAETYCNQCGHKNALGSNFCSSCGAILEPAGHDHTTIVFHPDRPADSPEDDVTVDLDAVAADTAVLVVKRGPKAGSRFVLDQDITTAGRHPDSDIFLDDITVSRRHVEIRRTDEGYSVRDAGSLNGTYINRERIDERPLANGDELQIGKFKLVFFVKADAE
jgi:pSer/pThr/pTyr-binding forkhead associated (FHA) protein